MRGREIRGLRRSWSSVWRAVWLCTPVLLLAVAGATYAYLMRPNALVVAVAPSGGTEPALLRAYADALAARGASIRLRLVAFGGVRESAEALQAGTVDLAVARPDVLMSRNALTLVVLRELATMIVAPQTSGIDALPDLTGKRLGIFAQRTADITLVRGLVERHGLSLLVDAPVGNIPANVVALVPVDEADLTAAIAEGLVDALILLTTPTTPAA